MPEISASKLAHYATRPDLEITLDGRGSKPRMEETEGTLGGRICRWLSVKVFGNSESGLQREQNAAGKDAVQNALVRIYGEEIGNRAYQANIGQWESRDGEQVYRRSSSDFPITGRHVRKMIESAEREIFAARDVVTFGKRGFRDGDGSFMTEKAIAGWIASQEGGYDESAVRQLNETDLRAIRLTQDGNPIIDEVQRDIYDLRSETVPGPGDFRQAGLDVASSVTSKLLLDTERWLAEDDGRSARYWTIDVENARRSDGASVNNLIGVRADRNDPDNLVVFDANRGMAKVPSREFTGWLAAHVGRMYGGLDTFPIKSMACYRVEERRLGVFARDDEGRWGYDVERTQRDPRKLESVRQEIVGKVGDAMDDNDAGLCAGFHGDVHRMKMLVTEGGEDRRLSPDNAVDTIGNLLGDESGDSERGAASRAISGMLCQSVVTTMHARALKQISVEGQMIVLFMDRIDPTASVSRRGDNFYFKYEQPGQIGKFSIGGDSDEIYLVNPDESRVATNMTLRVHIDELVRAGERNEPPNFTFVYPPEIKLHLTDCRRSSAFDPDRSMSDGPGISEDNDVIVLDDRVSTPNNGGTVSGDDPIIIKTD